MKLADFGLARETGDASAIGRLTATTDQFGTAYYLAPERMTGTTSAGPEGPPISGFRVMREEQAEEEPGGHDTRPTASRQVGCPPQDWHTRALPIRAVGVRFPHFSQMGKKRPNLRTARRAAATSSSETLAGSRRTVRHSGSGLPDLRAPPCWTSIMIVSGARTTRV